MEKPSTKSYPQDFPERIGFLYSMFILDHIIDCAYMIAIDFSNRPEMYQRINRLSSTDHHESPSIILSKFDAEYGYRVDLPNLSTRERLFYPIFGRKKSTSVNQEADTSIRLKSQFNSSLIRVFAAAKDFSENSQSTGFPMLRERIRSALVPLKSYLIDLDGDSFDQTYSRINSIFNMASEILRNQNISSIFGIRGTIDSDWPLSSNNPDGAKLIEKITIQLDPKNSNMHTRNLFVRMQRIAEKGRISLSSIIRDNFDEDDPLDALTTQIYAWGSDAGLYNS